MDHLGHRRVRRWRHLRRRALCSRALRRASPSRVSALALVSPMGPVADPRCRKSLSRFHRFCLHALPRSPRADRAVFALFRWSLDRSPRLAARLATLRGGPRDKAVIAQPEVARGCWGVSARACVRECAARSRTCQLFSRDWGVDLEAIRAPARAVDRHRRHRGAARSRRGAGAPHPRLLIDGADGGRSFLGGARATREVLDWIARRDCSRGSTQQAQRRHPCGDASRRSTASVTPARCAREAKHAFEPIGGEARRGLHRGSPGSGEWPRWTPSLGLRLCLDLALLRTLHPTSPSRSQRPARRYSAFPYSWHQNSEARQAFQDWLPGSATYPARAAFALFFCAHHALTIS